VILGNISYVQHLPEMAKKWPKHVGGFQRI